MRREQERMSPCLAPQSNAVDPRVGAYDDLRRPAPILSMKGASGLQCAAGPITNEVRRPQQVHLDSFASLVRAETNTAAAGQHRK
jgi:hypothetical protein